MIRRMPMKRLMKVLYSESRSSESHPTRSGLSGLAAGFEQDYSALAVPLRVGDQPYGSDYPRSQHAGQIWS